MSKHSALNNFGRSGNPAFRNHFDSSQTASNTSVRNPSYQNHFEANQSLSEGTMSLDGTVNKTGILLALCVGGAFFGWNAPGLALPAVIIGFVIALFTIFKPKNSPYTAPAYAAIEGVALGAITMVFEAQYPGIGIQAIGLTFGILASLLFCYKSGIIKPIITAGRANPGAFQPKNAPPKHKARRIPVLFTVPSRVIVEPTTFWLVLK